MAKRVDQKKMAYHRYLCLRTNKDWVAYGKLNKEVKSLVMRQKNASWDQYRFLDSTLGYNRFREYWGILKKFHAARKGNIVPLISDGDWMIG